MGSRPTFEPRFAHRWTDAPLGAPVEWEPAWLLLDAPLSAWDSVRVTRNGAPLAVQLRKDQTGTPQVACEWPRSDPGRYRLRIEAGAAVVEREVRVDPGKITTAAFAALLDELNERLPAEVALSLQRAGALTGVELRPPDSTTLAGELSRIRRAIRGSQDRLGLVAILDRVGRDPHRALADEAPWVRSFEARSPDPGQLARALMRAENLDVERRPLTVIDRRSVEHFDTYENRVVRTFVSAVRARAGRLTAACEAAKRTDSAAEVRALLRELDLARRQASFLDHVSDLAVPPTRLTMVLQRKPGYRAALEGFLAFLRSSSARLDAPALDAPLDNLPALYQLWGTLQVCLAVVEVAAKTGHRVETQRLVSASPGGVYVRVLPDGVPAVVLRGPSDVRVAVIPERSYGHQGSLRSMSFVQRPDVAVEVRRPTGTAVWLFDPKYKLASDEGEGPGEGRPKKVDIDKMHAYRDSIRDAGGERVVRFAATLYPGVDCAYGEGLAAIQARPGDGEALRLRIAAEIERALGFAG